MPQYDILSPEIVIRPMFWAIAIPGIPRPQSRPRIGRGGHFYSSSHPVQEWKRTVRDYVSLSPPKVVLTGPIQVTMRFSMPRPKSMKPGPPEPHAKRPDADNLAKAVLDALQGCGVFDDDAQVWMMVVRKVYAETGEDPGVFVHVRGFRREDL